MISLPLATKKRKVHPTPQLFSPDDHHPKLTVLSFGGGQDSTAILYMLAFNKMFRRLWAPNDLLVVMSDTGNEHPETYLHIQSVRKFCEDHDIDFVFITKDMGFHNTNWQSLTEYFAHYDSIMSAAYPKTCTDNLKIQVIYRYLNRYLHLQYGVAESGGKWNGKRALVEFGEQYGHIRVLIGIAKGEESRIAPQIGGVQWMRRSIMKSYPLIWLEWDRQACQDYIRKQGMIVPPPSNCMFCPFMNDIELLWLALKYPDAFAEWVEYERKKKLKFAHKGKSNYGALHPSKDLTQILAEARVKYAGYSAQQLQDYRFSHGHCTMSKH
jgi:3'-phosphoadenosine 5'-phosphosulfate sulfotransferase (PAPS reductase)/FAD synthetase